MSAPSAVGSAVRGLGAGGTGGVQDRPAISVVAPPGAGVGPTAGAGQASAAPEEATASRNASASARADCGRSAGSFARQRSTTPATAAGTAAFGFRSTNGGGGVWRWA